MKPKIRKTSRLTLAVRPETRKMLNDLAFEQNRNITGVIENLIKIEYHKLEEQGGKWVP